MHLEIILPRIPRIFTDFDYFEINIRVIIEICVLLRTQYPCSSVLSVGDSLCCLRFILPRIPQIFTDFIYSNIRAHLCYLWETPSHPISVFICDICGSHHLQLEIILPRIPRIFTDFDYFEINIRVIIEICVLLRTQYPCSSVLSVGDSLCCLRFILPRIPQIFTDFIYSNIRAHLCYLWETPSHPISVFICDICGSHHLQLEIYSPTDHRFSRILYILRAICDGFIYMMYMWEPDEINSH